MLRELRIVDFAIIDEAFLEFGDGFNVLTGETGAGKSILIEALGIALGGRSSGEMIRSSCDKAQVEARFDLAGLDKPIGWLKDNGFYTGEEMIVRRIVSRTGRNRAFINGSMATVAQVSEVGDLLVDIHGQNEHQTLLDPGSHLRLLDSFLDLAPLRASYERKFGEFKSARDKLDATLRGQKETERRIDLLRHQVGEIEAASLAPGVDKKLCIEKSRLNNAEKLRELTSAILDNLDDNDNSATSQLQKSRGWIEQMIEMDGSLALQGESLASALFGIEEVAGELRKYAETMESDPARLAEVDDRLDLIGTLKRKYGDTIEEVLEFHDRAARELESLEFNRDHLEKLQDEADKLGYQCARIALELDGERVKGATGFSAAAQKQLGDLNMEHAQVVPSFSYGKTDDVYCKKGENFTQLLPHGIGNMEILFNANPGEPVKPLAKIASGGEISRLMLAFKTIISSDQPVPVMIFDEIDSGMGGVTADRLGVKLRDLAKSSQVFCITHLPQVARYAQTHFQVAKSGSRGRTTVSITKMDRKERVAELARMAGGSGDDQASAAAVKWAEKALADVAADSEP